jgi:radical SAM superfamily enzyme YgiQ (UPF0313 family)
MLEGYVFGMFKFFMGKRNIRIDNSERFNVILFSVYDPIDIIRLRMLRQAHPDVYIIAGGIEGFSPAYILTYADAVCVGEGFEFMQNVPVDKGLQGLVEWVEEQPYMATRSKIGQEIKPSYFIPWEELPVVKVQKYVYYYMVSKGCRNKCVFCHSSWMNPFTVNPRHSKKQFKNLAKAGQNCAMYLIGNDTGEFESPGTSAAAASVSVKRFLASTHQFKHHHLLHIGIEGMTEKRREWYGKPITNEEIRAVIDITKNMELQTELFFILENPYEMDELLYQAIPPGVDLYPRIMAKFTPIDPTPGTPMENYDLSQEKPQDQRLLHNALNSRNLRFRTFPILRLTASHSKTLLRRGTMEDTEKIMGGRRLWTNLEQWREYIDKVGLWKQYTGEFVKDFKIVHPYPFYENVKRDRVVPNAGKI